MTSHPARSMSVISLLRYINTHDVQVEHLRVCDARYLKPLLRAKLIGRAGHSVRVTPAGEDVLRGYTVSEMPQRKVERDLTEHCRNLLQAAVRLRVEPKTGTRTGTKVA